MRRVPHEVKEALASLAVPWELKQGARHIKVMVGGQLAGILPAGGVKGSNHRSTLNLVSQIRRVAATGGAARRG